MSGAGMSAAEAGVQALSEPDVVSGPSRSRVLVRPDLPAALGVVAAVAALGVPLGLLWSWLAPAEVLAVLVDPATGRTGVLTLPGQSEHRFDGMAILLLLELAAGVLTSAALWQLRWRRGPVVLAAAVLGGLLAGWLATRIGLALVDWYYPDLSDARPGDVVQRAPVLESGWVVVAQPFSTAMVYSVMVAWNGTEDLGRDA
jgi:hypothetical protein